MWRTAEKTGVGNAREKNKAEKVSRMLVLTVTREGPSEKVTIEESHVAVWKERHAGGESLQQVNVEVSLWSLWFSLLNNRST